MGTTRDAIRTRNPELVYVLCIEGYPYLITDGLASEAVTAWAATSWTQALTGLMTSGGTSQELKPWSNELSISSMVFSITSEGREDTFATDMFKSKPDVRAELTAGFDTGSYGGTFNIDVANTSDFSTGTQYIGNQAFDVTSIPSSTELGVSASGYGIFAPFDTDAGTSGTFPGPQSIGSVGNVSNYSVRDPVYVTDAPATWIGKKVGLYVHRVSGGVLDTKAQAELWFAGTIDSIDEGSNGDPVLSCTGIQESLMNTTIMANQWSARVKEGYTFEAGDWFEVEYNQVNNFGDKAARFTCVASGATAGGDNFDAGIYTADEIGGMLAQHCDDDTSIGAGSTLSVRWTGGTYSSDVGPRWKLQCQETGSVNGQVTLTASNAAILTFLGFDDHQPHGDIGAPTVVGPVANSEPTAAVISGGPAFKVPPITLSQRGRFDLNVLNFEDTEGTFFDHTSDLPPAAAEYVGSGETWSFYAIGDDILFLGRRDSDTQISGIRTNLPVSGMSSGTERQHDGVRDDIHGSVRVRQVLFMADTFCAMVAKFFASIDGNGANHATYDAYPWGAGIPWSLLGDSFLDSLSALEQSGAEDSLAVLVDKPTRLWDILAPDFALRMAMPIWKEGGIQIAQFTVPNASTADHTLTEANKFDSERTETTHTSEYLAHTLKIDFNRKPLAKDEYLDHYVARAESAYHQAGGAGVTKTIKARNSYSAAVNSGASVEALAESLIAGLLPIASKPLKVWTRSITHRFFHMAPGDSVLLDDDDCRDPTTGKRGITQRPCIVTRVSSSLGFSGNQEQHGEVELLYTEEDRAFPMAYSAEHVSVTKALTGRSWTAGYDDEVGTPGVYSLLVHATNFAPGNSAVTDRFSAGDVIRITERDPPSAGSADSFTDTVVSAALTADALTCEIVLTTGFGNGGNPAFVTTKNYYVNFAEYDLVQTSQKLCAFQADTDNKLADLAEPNLYANKLKVESHPVALTELPERHSNEQFGDGVACSTSLLRNLIRMANNLLNHKTAPQNPQLADSFSPTTVAAVTSGAYQVIWTMPFYVGPDFLGTTVRKLNVGCVLRAGSGTKSCRVTSSANPPKGTTFENATFSGPKQQVTFSTSDTTNPDYVTSAELQIVRAENIPELTWLTLEGEDGAQVYGIHELWEGAAQ